MARLTHAYVQLEPGAVDPLGRRRNRAAARRLAALAANAAAGLHGAFGDRPDPDRALARVVAAVGERAQRPGPSSASALGEVAAAALALPPLAEEDDWLAGAIAFVDERLLRDGYEACVTLAAMAVRDAAAA